MALCSSCDGVPLKFKKENGRASRFTSTDYLSLLLTPLRIRWTIPLKKYNRGEIKLEHRTGRSGYAEENPPSWNYQDLKLNQS
jgi:hypothetical protein